MVSRGGAVCTGRECKLDDNTGENRGWSSTCASTQAERGSANLPTDTDRWVGSSPPGIGAGLDWLTGSLSVDMVPAYPGLKRDTPAVDPSAELAAVASMIAAMGGYQVLGPSTQHSTQWYHNGTFAD